MDDLEEFSARLGVAFRDPSLLSRALTHRSYLNENPGSALEDNERLEFLGDAVIDFVVAGFLYHRFPEMDEGELTALRAALVRAETLAAFARQIELDRYLRLGLGELPRPRPGTGAGVHRSARPPGAGAHPRRRVVQGRQERIPGLGAGAL